MVQTPSLSPLISWANNGLSFSVYNPTEFSKSVLPMFFKHNNFQSFVRQVSSFRDILQARADLLSSAAQHVRIPQVRPVDFPATSAPRSNLVYTRRVNDMIGTVLAGSDGVIAWEFQHAAFQRDRPELLARIKRKSSKAAVTTPAPPTPPALHPLTRKSIHASSSTATRTSSTSVKDKSAPNDEAYLRESSSSSSRPAGVVVPEASYFERPAPIARASGTFHRAKAERGESTRTSEVREDANLTPS